MTTSSAPMPLHDPIATPRDRRTPAGAEDLGEGMVTEKWVKWLTDQTDAIDAAPTRLGAANLTAQSASIGATEIPAGVLSAGLYAIWYYFRVTTPASSSSKLIISFAWTDGGVSPALSGSAVEGNLTTSVQSGNLLVRIDAATPVTYAMAYTSSGATAMQYSLDVILERAQA